MVLLHYCLKYGGGGLMVVVAVACLIVMAMLWTRTVHLLEPSGTLFHPTLVLLHGP